MTDGEAATERRPTGLRARAGHAYAVSLGLCALVVMPGLRPLGYDSFPWSSYPMFSDPRPREATIAHALALSFDGQTRRPVPPPLLGSDEVLQALATVRGAIRGHRTPALCRRIAATVAETPGWSDFEWIEIASDRYDVLTYFGGSHRPLDRSIHTRCRIPR
ncbi:MAG: hypothetical protein R3B09_23375 [Nannocystaceae bacterium]